MQNNIPVGIKPSLTDRRYIRLLKNVIEAASARQKQTIRSAAENMPFMASSASYGSKRNLHAVNEHFEPVFNAAMATHDCMDAGGRATQEARAEIVFQQPDKADVSSK